MARPRSGIPTSELPDQANSMSPMARPRRSQRTRAPTKAWHGWFEEALAEARHAEGDQHGGVEGQEGGGEHAEGESTQAEQHQSAWTPSVHEGPQHGAQETRALVDGYERGDLGQRDIEPAREGARERIGEASRGIAKESSEGGRAEL